MLGKTVLFFHKKSLPSQDPIKISWLSITFHNPYKPWSHFITDTSFTSHKKRPKLANSQVILNINFGFKSGLFFHSLDTLWGHADSYSKKELLYFHFLWFFDFTQKKKKIPLLKKTQKTLNQVKKRNCSFSSEKRSL